MSEHEGFCVPLLEAMAADVPIMAYAAAAVPDTLGGAGVQLETKNLEYAAELLGSLAFDDDLRAKVIAGQRRRLADFGEARIVRELERILASMKLAFIIQRYGTEVLWRSRTTCRLVAERLAAQHDVEVLMTCARDYVTWKNEYQEGPDRVRGVTVAPLRERADTRYLDIQQVPDWIFSHPPRPCRRDGMAEASGSLVYQRLASISAAIINSMTMPCSSRICALRLFLGSRLLRREASWCRRRTTSRLSSSTSSKRSLPGPPPSAISPMGSDDSFNISFPIGLCSKRWSAWASIFHRRSRIRGFSPRSKATLQQR